MKAGFGSGPFSPRLPTPGRPSSSEGGPLPPGDTVAPLGGRLSAPQAAFLHAPPPPLSFKRSPPPFIDFLCYQNYLCETKDLSLSFLSTRSDAAT